MAINVTGNIANIAVNTTSNVVTVSSSPVNVQLSATSVVSNTSVRQAITVSNLSGFGNLTYDSSNISNGVIQYTGTANSDITTVIVDNPSVVRGALSNTSPITYNNSTGVIGLEQTLDDLTLKKYQETVVDNGTATGNVSVDISNGTVQKFTLSGNITGITINNMDSGGSATIFLNQDNLGGNSLDVATHPSNWTDWDFVNDFSSLSTTGGAFNILNVLRVGSVYYASMSNDSQSTPAGLSVLGNITAGGNITSNANIEGVTLKGTGALGLVVNGNATIGGNLDVTGNINSETVVDLFVEDRNITMQYGAVGTPSANSQIFIDRGDEANSYVKWDESTDKWKFSNDGSTEYAIPSSTSDLAEGTNLYYTNSRADARIDAYTGGFANLTSNVKLTTTGLGNASFITENLSFPGGGSNPDKQGQVIISGNGIIQSHGVGNHINDAQIYGGLYTSFALSSQSDARDSIGRLYLGANAIYYAGYIEYGRTYPSGNPQDTNGTFSFNHPIGGGFSNVNNTEYANIKMGQFNVGRANTSTDLNFYTSNITTYLGTAGNGNVSTGYLHGDGSNITGIVGDIESVTAGTGLTGGGTTGAVTLNVGAGTGITANPDDIAVDMSAFSTSDLSEGTNLYYTDARFDTRLAAKSTTNLTEGTNLYFTDARARGNISVGTPASASSGGALAYNSGTGVFTFTPADTQTDAEVRALVSVGTPATPSGNGALAYDNSTGIFTLTPADTGLSTKDTDDLSEGSTNLYYTDSRSRAALSTTTASASGGGSLAYDSGTGVFTFAPADLSAKIELTNLSVTTAAASGDGSLAYDNTSGVFTFTPADAGLSDYGDSNVVTLLSAFGSNTISSTANITTTANVSTGNVLTDHVISDSAQPLQLKGQTNGIQLDKTISSTETKIVDIDTDGYRITSADAHTASIASYTGGVKGLLILGTATAGSPTVTTLPLSIIGYPPGHQIAGQSASTSYFDLTGTGQTIEAALANVSAFGGVQNGAGWKLFNTAGGFLVNFDRDTHVSSISGSTLTMNKNATVSGTAGFIMFPGVASSTQNMDFLINYTVGTYNFEGLQPFTTNYALPDTLSNVTIDKTSVSSGFDLANVKLGHIADLEVGTNDYVRVPKGLLIGETAEPDPFSSRNSGSSPAGAGIIGLTLEHNGETEYAANNTPQTKFLINNYTANSILGMATTPSWAADFGSGNITVANQYLSAPAFNFKTLNSSKLETANGEVLANTVVGQLVWNAPSDTVALDNVGTEVGLNSGSDLIHPPAGIKVRMASDQTQASNTTAMDMYVQSSYRTSYRDGTTDAKGSIPRTFLANKEGNTVLAAKTDGKITLRPVRDYGTTGTDTSFTENRYAHALHEYHEFLGAGFLSSKAGTLVEIQPKSGETGGSANFNYDSKGDATFRLSTHEANNTVKKSWDITSEQSSANLIIRDHTNSSDKIEVSGARTEFNSSVRLQNLTTTQINALSGPAAGDVVFNTTENLICVYNGTAWRKINDAAL